jgi:hypothetical protein
VSAPTALPVAVAAVNALVREGRWPAARFAAVFPTKNFTDSSFDWLFSRNPFVGLCRGFLPCLFLPVLLFLCCVGGGLIVVSVVLVPTTPFSCRCHGRG